MKKISRWGLLAGLGVLSLASAVQVVARPAVAEVSFTGTVTCAHCVDLAQHKGFTRWTWAMYRVSQGDRIIFVTSGKTYTLEGDRQQLSKYVEDKATVSGRLEADTIEVTSIAHPAKQTK
jgi:hypothetical protein